MKTVYMSIRMVRDGSKMDDLVAASFTVPSLNIDKTFRFCNKSSVYAAELTAIMEAVLWILNCEHYNKCKFAILSDSLSVLTPIKESCSQSRPTLLNDLLSHLNKLDSNQIKFIWIPSHIGVTVNERADALAKEALSIDYMNSTDYLEFEELFTLIKTYIVNMKSNGR